MHPLGVVPKAPVDWKQSAGVLELVFHHYHSDSVRAFLSVYGSSGGTLSAPTGCSP